MKNLNVFFLTLIAACVLTFTTGCGDDEPVKDIAPLLLLADGPNPGSTISELGGAITIKVDASKGTSPMNTLTISENGVKVALNRLTFVGQSGGANPFLLTGANKDAFVWETLILAHDDTYGSRTYTVTVADEKGLTGEVSFDITIIEPIEKSLTGILWNQAGPAGRGGIDLDDGSSTGTKLSSSGDPAIDTSYLRAELRDMGIDSLAGSGDNWRRRIGAINGSDARFLGNNLPDFNFDNVDTKEAVTTAFDTAAPFTETLLEWGAFKVSHKLAIGDIFVVKSGDRYYLVRVDDIVETTTIGNNEDQYLVSIKY